MINFTSCFAAFCLAQVQQRAAEKWKDVDAATRSLRLCLISTMLKVECCVNGTHSMDEVGLGGFGLYETLPGLDCTFPRFFLLHQCILISCIFILKSHYQVAWNKDNMLSSILLKWFLQHVCTSDFSFIVFFLMQWLWRSNQKLDVGAPRWLGDLQPACALCPLEQHRERSEHCDRRVRWRGEGRCWSCYCHTTSR